MEIEKIEAELRFRIAQDEGDFAKASKIWRDMERYGEITRTARQ